MWWQNALATAVLVLGTVVGVLNMRRVAARDRARAELALATRAADLLLGAPSPPVERLTGAPEPDPLLEALTPADREWLDGHLRLAAVPAPANPRTGWHWRVAAPTPVDEPDAQVDAYRADYAARHGLVDTLHEDLVAARKERPALDARLATDPHLTRDRYWAERNRLEQLPPRPCNCSHHPITGCPDLQQPAASSQNPTGNEATL